MENCIKYQERISAFIDGLLPEAERLELMEHMAHCPDCRQYFDDQTAIHDAMTALEADAPAGFTEAVMARVRETKQDVPEKKTFTFPHWQRWAATAACCALVLLGVMGLQNQELDALAPMVQNTVHFNIARTQEDAKVSADDTALPVSETPSMASAPSATAADSSSAAPSAPLADTAQPETSTGNKEAAGTCTLTTASPLAAQWIEDNLDDAPQAAGIYLLTQEQFDDLRSLLETEGAAYSCTESTAGEDAAWYLVLQAS